MAENPKVKIAIPALTTTAYSAKQAKKRRTDLKRKRDNKRNKTRISIGGAFQRWRDLRDHIGVKLDSELAFLLLDTYEEMMATSNPQKGRYSARLPDPAESNIVSGSLSEQDDDYYVASARELNTSNINGASSQQLDTSYLRIKSESRPERSSLKRSSSTETCESVHYEYPFMMSSPNKTEQETCAAPSVQTSENEKESGIKDTACQRFKEEWTSSQSESKDNRDHEEDKDAEFSTSLSVGDGRYLVDLGSSSEFVVDEECILQLFKSCRECSRQCTVRKHVKGLKLVVYQSCCFCQSRCEWTNLPDDDDGDFQINGKAAAHGQANSAMSPSSNTS